MQHRFAVITAVVALGTASPATAGGLKADTARAYDAYIRIAENVAAKTPVSRPDSEQLARKGEIVIHDAGDSRDVPGGLIHDWAGVTFVPGAQAEDVVRLLRAFDRHHRIYPEVIQSNLFASSPERVRGRWRLRKQKFITVVLNVDMEAEYSQVGPRWFVASRSTRVAEVKDAGKPEEKELPAGKERGFLWRLNAYWWIEPADRGVFVHCRTISLTRKAPRGLGWLVGPMIEEVPRESLISTLESTRAALVVTPAGEFSLLR